MYLRGINFWSVVAILALLVGIVTGPGLAQQDPQEAPPQQGAPPQQEAPPQHAPPAQQAPGAPAVSVDQQTLEAAAKAYLDIQEIRDEFLPQIEGATDQAQAQQLQQQANQRMVAAIEKNDLEIEEYNEIIQAVSQDDQLRSEFLALVKKEQEARRG